jgi:WhiB family redox-sensing transcriptional regulator
VITDLEDPQWRDRAACLGKDLELFFAPKGRNDLIQQALGICDGCPVKRQCLGFELTHSSYEDDHGVFGGTTEKDRKALRRRGAA